MSNDLADGQTGLDNQVRPFYLDIQRAESLLHFDQRSQREEVNRKANASDVNESLAADLGAETQSISVAWSRPCAQSDIAENQGRSDVS